MGSREKEIRWDLHTVLGLDLDDWFKGYRSWEDLMYFLAHMPQGSHYWAAQMSDEDLARSMVDLEQAGRFSSAPQSPSLVGWSDVAARLTDLTDLVSALIHQNAHDQSFKPAPRPEFAYEKVKRERKDSKMSSIAAKMTGGG